VFEKISQSFQIENDENHENKLADEIKKLFDVLNYDKKITKKISAIDRAQNKIKEINNAYTSLKIAHTVKQIGLSELWNQAYKDFYKIRNAIAHGGFKNVAQLANNYTPKKLTLEFFQAYICYKIKQ